MILKIIILAIGFLLTINTTVFAQSTTDRQIKKTGKEIEKTVEAVESIKTIFKKKDKNRSKEQEEHTSGKVTYPTSGNNKNGNTREITKKDATPVPVNPNQLKPGDINPDAVVLDVDELYPFHKGAAIVAKGSSTALINNKGEFIVPFNKYNFVPTGSANGFFIVGTDRNQDLGFVTSKGRFVLTKEGHGTIRGDYYEVQSSNSKIYYDIGGNRYEVTRVAGNISEGLVASIDQKTLKVGYKNIKDQWAIKPQYESASSFMNGAAIVSNFNEFGELKFGYIDKEGNAITPLLFTNLPMPFSNDLALVRYSDHRKYAFINKKGEVVFNDSGFPSYDMFTYGFSLKDDQSRNRSMVMDKNWKEYTVQEFLSNYGIEPVNNSGKLFFPNYSDNNGPGYQNYNSVLPFSFFDGRQHNYGYIFWNDSTVIYGNFQRVPGQIPEEEFHFDEISGLKRANWRKGKDYNDVHEGYVNKAGVFMIIKGEESKW